MYSSAPPQQFLVYSNSSAGQKAPEWSIGFCEFGNCSSCCYACFLPCCAVASARHTLDDSDWCVNVCCLGTSAARYLARTAYNIPGTAQWDCCLGALFPCCAANQLYQTVQQNGKVKVQNVGATFNTNERVYASKRSCCGLIYDCAYATVCTPCAVGYTLESAGVPCWFGACCFSPMAAVSVQRYTRRIKPTFVNECFEDCFLGGLCTLPCFCRAFAEENVYRNRASCCYGLDCISFLGYSISYICGCGSCSMREGRYLISEA